MAFVGILATFLTPTWSHTTVAELDAGAVLDSISRYLAEQWGFPYTGFVGDGYLRIGHVYGYDGPSDYCELLKYQKRGRKIEVSLFDSTLNIESIRPIQTQRYLVQDRLATYIATSLSAQLRTADVSLDAFRESLKDAQLRFVVSRVAYPEAELIRKLRKVDLNSEMQQSAMHGFVSPHELLVVSNFDYSETALKEGRGGLALSWLPALRSSISRNRSSDLRSSLGVPDLSVAAFKVIPFPPGSARCR